MLENQLNKEEKKNKLVELGHRHNLQKAKVQLKKKKKENHHQLQTTTLHRPSGRLKDDRVKTLSSSH
jgi:hypothetical protein